MEQALTDRDKMPFGKYKGKTLANVPAAYLLYLYNDGCTHEPLKRYIIDNLDGLNGEVNKIKNYGR